MLIVGACLVVPACGNGNDPGPGEAGFVADNPNRGGGGTDGQTGAAEDGGSDDNAGEGGDPERAISEADIVHIEGDRLYALSAFGGLTVIDVADPDHMVVLGHHRAQATPFEMYVDDGQVFVMYSEYGSYAFDEALGGYAWRSSSKLVALDASDPSDVVVRGEFDLPGRVQDSRRVGDVLYLVTHEDGYCWGCESRPNTVVASLDISNPAQVELVEQIRLGSDTEDAWAWEGQRSVSATDERLYIAGPEFGDGSDDGHSVIEVIDISDPGGALLHGASVPVAGQIQNRWQMDEFEGVLRVVSQPGFWGGTEPPVIETFSVASAESVQPLAALTMTLPRPESLRSVRFDGDRGYAITFEQTDPLFTLDLADPGAPQQVGELEIPGWVHHMEPRGDRVLALGFDPGNAAGSLNVSLFDVSDFTNPSMLSRVHFGGDWGNFGEGQNQLHKSFTILEELGLILVPFSGWSWEDNEQDECGGSYDSGIQLVDWSDDALGKRGSAPAHGQARRALVHRDRLIGMSDKSVEVFDISDRDAPLSTDELPLATNVTQVGLGDGVVVRLSQDWWSGETVLEVADADDLEAPEALGSLDLRAVLEGDSAIEGCWYWGLYSAEVIVHGDFAYLVREQGAYYEESQAEVYVDVIDIGDPTAPQYVDTVAIDTHLGWSGNGIVGIDELRVVKHGDAIVIAAGASSYSNGDTTSSIHVVDLSVPDAPVVRPALRRPAALSHGMLQTFGDDLVSWHMESANEDASKVHFYLDRIDVSDPGAPTLLKPINVPGIVVGYDSDSDRVVTVNYALERVAGMTADDCYSSARVVEFDAAQGCILARREMVQLQIANGIASVIGTQDLEGDDGAVRSVATSEQRIFAQVSRGGYGWDEATQVEQFPVQSVAVLPDWTSGPLAVASSTEIENVAGYIGLLRAAGESVVFNAINGLVSVDASDPADPEVTEHSMRGYGCWNLRVHDGVAMCPMGEYGLQTVSLE